VGNKEAAQMSEQTSNQPLINPIVATEQGTVTSAQAGANTANATNVTNINRNVLPKNGREKKKLFVSQQNYVPRTYKITTAIPFTVVQNHCQHE
jgi:hypothetical protein